MIRTNTLLLTAALLLTVSAAGAQQTTPPTFLEKQLSRIDLGVSGAALINPTVSGPIVNKTNPGQGPTSTAPETEQASNTAGALVNIRYTAKPLVGFEFNFLYSRYTENFSPNPQPAPFGVQTQGDEFSLGYLVTPKVDIFGLQPYASVGLGTTEFKPTAHGGESLPKQARMTYYYSFGVQKDILSNFGLRAGFRQTFYLAPDFGQNYLTILKHTTSYEPNAGFYLRF